MADEDPAGTAATAPRGAAEAARRSGPAGAAGSPRSPSEAGEPAWLGHPDSIQPTVLVLGGFLRRHRCTDRLPAG
jgi:hypothetical protein